MLRSLALAALLVAVVLPLEAKASSSYDCAGKIRLEAPADVTATSATLLFDLPVTTCDTSMWASYTTLYNGVRFYARTPDERVYAPHRGAAAIPIGPLFPGATYDVTIHAGQQQLNEQLTTLSRLAIYRSVGGSVKASAGPIDCGEACTEELPTGTIRSLTALAGSGFRFSHWEGACTGAAPACSVTVSGDMQASAFFAPARTLTVQRDGSGAGSVESTPGGISCGALCSAVFDAGASVVLRAAPAEGSSFAGWTGGGCTGLAICTVSLANDLVVTATFTKLDVLTIEKRGKGAGRVTSDLGGIDCGASCSTRIARGSTLTLRALPARGSRFLVWGGACAGTKLTCTVALGGDATVTATFARKPKRRKPR